jgi:hypothetical protein
MAPEPGNTIKHLKKNLMIQLMHCLQRNKRRKIV